MGAFSGFVGLLEKIDLNSALSAFSGRVPDVDVENAKSENLGKSVCYSCVTFLRKIEKGAVRLSGLC